MVWRCPLRDSVGFVHVSCGRKLTDHSHSSLGNNCWKGLAACPGRACCGREASSLGLRLPPCAQRCSNRAAVRGTGAWTSCVHHWCRLSLQHLVIWDVGDLCLLSQPPHRALEQQLHLGSSSSAKAAITSFGTKAVSSPEGPSPANSIATSTARKHAKTRCSCSGHGHSWW